MPDLSEIRTRDKRNAAIHEAGHLTVALALKVRGRAWIFPSATHDMMAEKLWVGKFQAMTCQGVSRPVICIAGVVAECLADDPQIEATEIVDFIDCGIVTPSPTDMMGISVVSEEIVSTALELCRENKTFFDWAVAKLIRDESVTDGMAGDYFHSLGCSHQFNLNSTISP